MHKHLRHCIAIARGAGLTVEGIDTSRRHPRILCSEGVLTFPGTPSDARWTRHMASAARRLARGTL